MKRLLMVLTMLVTTSALALECPKYTARQAYILDMAYTIGSQHDTEIHSVIGDHIGHTMAAIVTKESFIGSYIFRHNPNDPSFGVSMFRIKTLMWLDSLDYTWENRAKYESWYIDQLINNDQYALISMKRLLKYYLINTGSIFQARKRYNGGGQAAQDYAQDVTERVSTLIRCGYLK